MERLPLIAPKPRRLSRRELLRQLFFSAGAASALAACRGSDAGLATSAAPNAPSGPAPGGGAPGATCSGPGRFACIGPLADEPDDLGFRLPTSPPGFSVRVIAESLQPPLTSKPQFLWPLFPDGSGILPTDDGGWIYVVNSEVPNVGSVATLFPQASPLTTPIQTLLPGLGGASALRFDKDANLVDAYSILSRTTFNCAGVITPWKTWLSCEEVHSGQVWECDPTGAATAVVRPALGRFDHEAVAVDMAKRVLYMTEDWPDGRFYRFVPSEADWPAGAARPALSEGRLQVMKVGGDGIEAALKSPQPVSWVDAANPGDPQVENRVDGTAAFDGGEGLWYFNGYVYFSTKGDNRIWLYDSVAETIEVIYDVATSDNPILSGVDNITVTPQGDVLVAEDGGDMQIVVILPDRTLKPLLQLTGQDGSELSGIAFSPDGRRLYFNSDRGGIVPNLPEAPGHGPGITYELTLPEGL